MSRWPRRSLSLPRYPPRAQGQPDHEEQGVLPAGAQPREDHAHQGVADTGDANQRKDRPEIHSQRFGGRLAQ